MALREFDGKLDATPKLKEFTGNLDGESQSVVPMGDPMGGTLGSEILAVAAPRRRSVLEGLPADPSKFDFKASSALIRGLESQPAPMPAAPRQELRAWTPPEPRSIPRAIADTVLGLYQGSNGMVKGVTDNINAGDNPISSFLETASKGADRLKSDDLRDQQVKRNFEIYAAKKNMGETGAARAAYNSLFTQPAAGLDVVARGAGSLGPTVGLGLLGAGAKTMGTVNALSNAGDAASQTADTLRNLPPAVWANDGQYQELVSKGVPHAEAVSILVPFKVLPAQAVGAVTGLVSGSTGVEKVIAGNAVGNSVKQRVGRVISELLGEQAETLVPQSVGNVTVGGIDGKTKFNEGLGQSSIDTLAGTVPGAAMSARRVPEPAAAAPTQAPNATPTSADYEALVQKVFGGRQAPAAPTQQAPQQAIQSLASLIANTATQDSPLNVPKLTPVGDDIQLDKEPVTDGAENVLQPVDSNAVGAGPLNPAAGVESVQRVLDTGKLDITGNAATEPTVRTAPLEPAGQLPEQIIPATEQPAANVAAPVTQPSTLVATEAGAGGAQPSQVAPTPAATPKASTGYIGQDGTSIDEGGTPFKSKLEAQKAKKLQPMMRVKQVVGGFVLADKTPAQLAAEEKASKRIRRANAEAGSKGKPMAAHEFIASRGGMAPSERSDLGIEGNVKIGNRWLFAGKGKGMTIAKATEALQEFGYLKEDSHNAAYDLIKRSVSNPQYTDEGWEVVAELERQTQFEDYLAQQNETEDALGPLDSSDYTGDTGYEPASEELQAEVRALIEQLEAVGIDSELLIDEAVRENENKSDKEYYESAKQKLTNALAQNARSGSNEPNSGNAQGRQGQEAVDGSRADSGQVDGQPSNEGPTSEAGQESPDQGLTSYTPQEIEDRLAKLEQAEQERKRLDREAEQNAKAEREAKDIADRQRASSDNFQLGQSAEDSLSGQSDIFSAPQPQDAPTKPKVKIDDSGEVLEGARKLYAKNYAAKLDEGKGMDLAAVPLSKSWPEPDYQRLIDEGTDPWAVALARAVRDEVPTKPMKSWKLKGWVQQVEGLRDMAARAMSGNITKEQFMADGGRLNLADWFNKIDLYEAVGHANSLKTLTFSKGEYSFYAGEKFSPPKKLWTINMPSASASATWSNGNWGNDLAASDTKEETIEKFKAWASEQEGKEQDKPASKRTDFDVYSYRNRPKVFIVGKRISATKSIDLMEFETSKEANAYRVNNRAELEKMLAEAKAEQSERREENAPRVGEDHRNGADVTTEQFREAFGFRGEQFGASMPQSERQANMNQAYDALMDLAGVIGVPPKALSLNGELGLAFGARGKGGKNPAMAHYERDTTGAVTPNRVVINLTRKNGAGSLAHEWFHAVDNYFARMRGEKAGMLTESYPAKRDGVRPEMVDAFKRVMMAIQATGVRERSKHMDKKRTKDYWSTGLEMAARSFESYIIAKLQDKSGSNDFLANILPESAWLREESYPYPTMGELPLIRTAFDNFFATVQTKETDKGVAIFSQSGRSIGLPLGLRASVFTTEDEIEKRLEGLAHRPEVRVLDSAVGTLPGARDEDGISGANWEGRIYLFRDQLASRFDVQKTLFHELLHYGLRRFLTRDQFISQMTKLYERDAYIQAEADDWVKTKKGQETLADFGEKFARARGVDEALATLAEPNQGKYLKTDLFSRAQVTVTRWLAQLADALGFKDYAAKIRANKNEEARLLIQQIFTKLRENSVPVFDAWNDMQDMPFSTRGEKQQVDQAELDLGQPDRNFEPINFKDAFSREVDASGRKQYVLGRKLYDRMATYATDYLGRVKLADNRPTEFKQMMRQFRVDQNKATESAKAIAEKGMDLTPEQRTLLSDMIENQVKVADVPPQEMVELAASITAALETQANELVELGMLSEERLVKDYLPRLYKTPLIAQLSNKQMFMSWFTKTRMKIRGARLQSRGLVNEVPIEKVKLAEKFGWKVSSLADGDNLPQNLLDVLNSGGKIPAKYNGTKIVMWRDFTESERQDMGEVRDAVLRYAMGYVETQRDVAIGRLFKSVANNPDLAKTYNPGGWVQVPNVEIKGAPGTKTYGALAGMYIEPQVADSLKRNTQPKGVLMAAYDKALGWWKEGKTVWNPVSHGNNVVSNVFVMHFAGLNPANPANWRNTVREYRTKGQYYKEAVDKGLFGTEWATMEIQNLLMPDLADMADMESVASSRFSKMAEFLKKTGKPVSWYRENMQRAYEFEDQFFKLMIYADRRKAGMTPEQAIEDAERYIFNYADMPEGVENIKRIYSPFFSYTYKAVPMVIHTAMHHPDRLIAPIALLAGANWLGYLISGGDEDKERKGLPDYMQGRSAIGTQKAVRMPFNVEGKPAFMDVTRRVPLGDLFDVNNQTNGLPVPAPLMPSHPLLSMTAAIAWNVDTFSGKDLVKKSDTSLEAAQNRAGYIYKQLTPNAPFVPGSYNFNKLMDSAAYTFDTEFGPYTGRTKAGDPMPLSTTLPDVFTGTKIRAVDPERGIEYKRADIAKEEREIRANMRSANRNQSMTNDSRERYNQEQRDKLDTLRTKRGELQ